MVQSSIVVPATCRKRSIDGNDTPSEEVKRPRVEDSEVQQKRNKRLFGSLLGTLTKFKDETEKTSEIEKNRQAINEKLQEKLETEKKQLEERLKARKEEKIKNREEQIKIEQERLDKEKKLMIEKLELSKLIENEKLANFLKTSLSKPSLYYLPKKLTDDMEKTIKEQKQKALEARKEFESRLNPDKRRGDEEEERRGGRRRRDSHSSNNED